MMRTAIVIGLVALGACRTRATTARYAGSPVGACEAGRAYQAPPINAPTQPFIPLVATSSPAAPEPAAAPPADEPSAEAETSADADRPSKPGKKKPAKKPAKKKKSPEAP